MQRPNSARRAPSRSGWRKGKPAARSFAGRTLVLDSRRACPISPKTVFTTAAGSGNTAGRRITRASVLTNAAFVTAQGATALTGPAMPSAKRQNCMTPIRSSRPIQLMYWRPLPTLPPRPKRNGASIFRRAPPRPARTTPMRRFTTRIPASRGLDRSLFPVPAHRGQEIASGCAVFLQDLVSPVPVEADCGRADQDLRRTLEPCKSRSQKPCAFHPASADGRLSRRVPPAFGYVFTRQVDNRIRPLQPFGVYLAERGIPVDRVFCLGRASSRKPYDAVSSAPEKGRQATPDETGRARYRYLPSPCRGEATVALDVGGRSVVPKREGAVKRSLHPPSGRHAAEESHGQRVPDPVLENGASPGPSSMNRCSCTHSAKGPSTCLSVKTLPILAALVNSLPPQLQRTLAKREDEPAPVLDAALARDDPYLFPWRCQPLEGPPAGVPAKQLLCGHLKRTAIHKIGHTVLPFPRPAERFSSKCATSLSGSSEPRAALPPRSQPEGSGRTPTSRAAEAT